MLSRYPSSALREECKATQSMVGSSWCIEAIGRQAFLEIDDG
jgi:hypothetical protein